MYCIIRITIWNPVQNYCLKWILFLMSLLTYLMYPFLNTCIIYFHNWFLEYFAVDFHLITYPFTNQVRWLEWVLLANQWQSQELRKLLKNRWGKILGKIEKGAPSFEGFFLFLNSGRLKCQEIIFQKLLFINEMSWGTVLRWYCNLSNKSDLLFFLCCSLLTAAFFTFRIFTIILDALSKSPNHNTAFLPKNTCNKKENKAFLYLYFKVLLLCTTEE